MLKTLRERHVPDHRTGFGLPAQLATGRDSDRPVTVLRYSVRGHFVKLTSGRELVARMEGDIRRHATHPDGADGAAMATP